MSSAPLAAAPAGQTWPVRAYLLLLLAALILPSLTVAGGLLVRIARSEQARASAAALVASERTADALDRELAGAIASLTALATSPALASADLAAFELQARSAAQMLAQNFLLVLPSGQEALNTALPPGTAPPRVSNFEPAQRVFQTGLPVVSSLFVGATAHVPIISINVPVSRQDGAEKRIVYVLTLAIRPQRFVNFLHEQALPPGWIISVIDPHDVIVARSAEQDRFLGHLASESIRDNTAGASGTWTGTLPDGTSVLGAHDPLRLADWRVVVEVPLALTARPLQVALLLLGGAVAATALLSGVAAWIIARRIERPLHRLALQAAQLGQGETPEGAGPLGLREAERVAAALAQSGRALQERSAALAAERARLAALVEAVPVGLLIAQAPSGRIVFGNAQVERVLSHPVLTSANTAEYREWVSYHGDGRQVDGPEYPLARALAGEARPTLKARYRRGDRTLSWMQFVAAPIRDQAGAIMGAVMAIVDIDELERAREDRARFAERLEHEVRERTGQLEVALARLRAEAESRALAEDQLRQAQKMEAVGRLTGGIAHDFNNLLTVVIGSLDLLRRRLSDARQLRYVDNALEGAQRAATLTQQLLVFSRQQPLAPRPLDVNQLVQTMGEIFRRTLGEQVAVETKLAPELWQANVDPNQLESALLNLAVNARDAMDAVPGPQRLTVETDNAYLDSAFAAAHSEVVPGYYVMIAVSDTGSGMTPEIIEHAFEPFFTTKPIGKGTGLGLSQVHGFVKQSGGHVTIHSETSGDARSGAGQGTTIKLYLPRYRADAKPPPPDEPSESPADKPAGGLVLVVEDQESVRRFAAEALQDLGYATLEAADAPAALSLIDANAGIALLLTDVVLPGMDGRRLAEEARRRRPKLRVLFTTGYTPGATAHGGQPDQEGDVVAKPFTIASLSARLRMAFERSVTETEDGAAGR